MDDTSFKMFKLTTAGYCCTQIMLKMALDAEENENENTDLIRAANALCKGIAGTQKTCGVLTGGLQILSLYAAKGSDMEFAKEDYSQMMKEYMEWFEEEFESTECVDLIGVTQFEDDVNGDYQVKCGDILVKGYEKIQMILTEHGYEFGNRE